METINQIQNISQNNYKPLNLKTIQSFQPIELPKNNEAKEKLLESLKNNFDFSGIENNNLELSYVINEKTGQVVISVLDANTKEMIKQIPSEAIVKSQEALTELIGAFLNKKI